MLELFVRLHLENTVPDANPRGLKFVCRTVFV
jgi:hypothetical protein